MLRSELREYQREAVLWAGELEYVAMFADIGTGKTLMGLEILEHWHALGLRRFVVVCPMAVTSAWLDEIQKWDTPLVVAGLPKTKRVEVVKGEWDILVANFEAVRTLWMDIVRMRPQGLIVDESHNVKHRTAVQTKATRKIAQATRVLQGRRMIMTGTPMAKDPLGLWSQCDVLHPGAGAYTGQDHVLGYGPYKAYENAVAVVRPHPRLGNRVSLYSFPPERVKPVLEKMAPWTIVIRKEDVLKDLPEVSDVLVRVDMAPEQERLYRALKSDAIAALRVASGDLKREEWSQTKDVTLERYRVHRFDPDQALEDGTLFVSAPMITTLQVRLQQVTSGHIRTEDGKLVRLDNAKLSMLREEMPELCTRGGGKLLIFTRFVPDVEDIVKLAEELGIKALRLDSAVRGQYREIVHAFQTDDDVRVLVANIAVGREGLTMTAANDVLFYSHSTVPEHFTQARGRAHRIGQTRNVEYRTYLARNTIDERICGTNKERFDIAKMSIDDLKSYIEGV